MAAGRPWRGPLAGEVVAGGRRGDGREQVSDRRQLVGEHAHHALGCGVAERRRQRRGRRRRVAASVLGERPHDEDLDDAPRPSSPLGGVEQAIQEAGGGVEGALGEQQAGEGEVLVLPHVAELVVGREAGGIGPAAGGGEVAAGEPGPGCHRGHRSDRRRHVGVVEPLGLLEELEGSGEIALDLAQPGRHDPPAVRGLGEAGLLAELRGGVEVASRPVEVVAFQQRLGQAHVQVRRAPHDVTGRREHQRRCEHLLRVAAGVPARSACPRRERAPEHVADVARGGERV